MVQVAGGAASLVETELGNIPRLSPSGAQQLAADLEYVCNVLSALGLDVPRALPTWQVCLCIEMHDAQACIMHASSASAASELD